MPTQDEAGRIKAHEDIGLDCLMLHFHSMIEGISSFMVVAAGKVQPDHRTAEA